MVSSKANIETPIQYRSISSLKRKVTRGFTLIELMLATSLLMMVMFSGYYAYSLYSQKWQKRVQVFWHGTEQAIALDSLHKVLSSALPYMVNGEDDKNDASVLNSVFIIDYQTTLNKVFNKFVKEQIDSGTYEIEQKNGNLEVIFTDETK